ncbi:hypothetical protein [Frisingicoccus sp.]|uniref:hypothetical protein n=1 Tax=Frisingicoccus sp. TaxID=1918627 RepID=UPI002E76AFD2|nr:hypothetical protein [Frisingicoccus sp.]MEE0751191.1 hypothetical protein [Frisingicoccus sp.]
MYRIIVNTNTQGMSEDLKAAIVGAVLTMFFGLVAYFVKCMIGKVRVEVLQSIAVNNFINNDPCGDIESIEISANILCESSKNDVVSLYDWHAIVYSGNNYYEVQLDNLCDDSKYKFLSVVSLNRFQTCQIILHGRMDSQIMKLKKNNSDINSFRKIDRIVIQYKTSRGRNKSYYIEKEK